MALLACESFDTFNSNAQGLTKYAAFNTNSFPTGITDLGTRTSALGVLLTTKVLPTSGATCIIGMEYFTPTVSPAQDLFRVQEGATVHMTLTTDASGHLIVKQGSGTTLLTSTNTMTTATWYYIEFKVKIDNTTGTYEVRVNESSTNWGPPATGVDTQNGGTATWNTFTLLGSANSPIFDDLTICDGSGSLNNDFLGITKVQAKLPSTGNGSNTDFTTSTGTDHGALVDENPPNTTDYNFSATVNQRDTYNYPAFGCTGTVRGVQVCPYVLKTDAGARTATTVVRQGSTNYDGGTAFTPPAAFGYMPQIWETDPSTGPSAWTTSGVDAAEFGVKVVT